MPLLLGLSYICVAAIQAIIIQFKNVTFSISGNDGTPLGADWKRREKAAESFGVCLLINLLKDAEGRTWHSCTVGAPWVHVSAVWRAGGTIRSCIGFCFSQAEWRSDHTSCRHAPTELHCMLWLTSLIPGRCITSPFFCVCGGGGCHYTGRRVAQHFLSKRLTFSLSDEQQEVDERGAKTCPCCDARGLIYSC